MRHFITDTDVTSEELQGLLAVASLIKRRPTSVRGILSGSAIGLLFEKPSLRTRVSSEKACTLLGAHPVVLRGEELHLHRGETPEDSARVLSGYLDLLMARVISHTFLERLASTQEMPIVNGLSDKYHPLQALADLLTIQESFNNRLKGSVITYLGDSNNVALSLLFSGVMAGAHVILSSPEQYACSQDSYNKAAAIAANSGGSVTLEVDPYRAVRECQVLYTDVWISMGDEGEEEIRRKNLAPYQLNASLLKAAPKESIVMHCLPAHFDEEITREVFDSPQSRVIQQAHNRFPTAAAVFLFLLAREKFEGVRQQAGKVEGIFA